MTKHVDELKIAGVPHIVREMFLELQKTFGELKVLRNSFLNCGVQHTQDPLSREITLDQNHYVQNLCSIAHPQLSSSKAEDPAVPELHQLYMSLSGAVAYLAHTRVDILVFVSAMQRHTHKPRVGHVRKRNKLLL